MNRKANSLMTPPTEEEAIKNQKLVQLAFKTTGMIGRAMVPVASRGFKDRPKGWTPFNKFMDLNYSVVTVTDLETETVSVDFESICCAEGSRRDSGAADCVCDAGRGERRTEFHGDSAKG